MWHQKLSFMPNAVTKQLLLLLMLKQSRLAACRRMLSKMFQHKLLLSNFCEEIEELCCQGIKVDNNNEPMAKNIWAQPSNGSFLPSAVIAPTPKYPIQKEHRKFSWEEIGRMGEFDLYQMASKEEFVVEVIIPSTNTCLDKPLSL